MRRTRPKERLATRIDPAVSDWLATVARREGWTVTDAAEWALSGVRHLEHKLGPRLERFLEEQRAGGESLFVAIGRRVDSTFSADDAVSDDASIVPPARKPRGTRAA